MLSIWSGPNFVVWERVKSHKVTALVYPIKKNCTIFATPKLSSANAYNLDKAKILSSDKELTLYHTIPTFNNPEKKPFKNIVGKGENADNQYFLLFSQCFQPCLGQVI